MRIYIKSFRWLFSNSTVEDKLIFLCLVLGGLLAAGLESVSIVSVIPITNAIFVNELPNAVSPSEMTDFGLPSIITDIMSNLTINQILWYFVALFIFSIFTRILLLWCQTKFVQYLGHQLARQIIDTYISGEYKSVRYLSESDITALSINKCSDFVNSVLGSLFSVANAFFYSTAILLVFALFDLSSFVGLTLLIGSIYAVTFFLSNKILIGYSRKISLLLSRLLNILFEVMHARKEIELGLYPQYFLRNFSDADKKIRYMRVNVLILGIIPKYLIEASVVLALALFFQFGTSTTAPSLPILAAMVFALHRVLPLINTLYTAITNFQASSSMLNEVLDFINIKKFPNVRTKPQKNNWGSISVYNLSFSHQSNRSGLKRAQTHSFDKAKTYLIRGPSGCGKSTFLDCFSGVERNFSGKQTIKFAKGDSLDVGCLHEHLSISYVTQSTFVHRGTVLENITFDNKDFDQGELFKICDLIGIKKETDVETSENKLCLDQQCGEKGMYLSGGQKQRVALARVLMQGCDVLLCDEALSATEYKFEVQIIKRLKKLFPELCVLYVSHRDGLEQYFDKNH